MSYYLVIFLKKNNENPGSQLPARHSSRASPEYKLEALPLKPTCFRGKPNQILKFPL
jgi:hypothetical protein